jgi:hypothetical protein
MTILKEEQYDDMDHIMDPIDSTPTNNEDRSLLHTRMVTMTSRTKISTVLSTSPTHVSELSLHRAIHSNPKPEVEIPIQTSSCRHDDDETRHRTRTPWPILLPSNKSIQTRNPIREIVDPIVASASRSHTGIANVLDEKTTISLAVRVKVKKRIQSCILSCSKQNACWYYRLVGLLTLYTFLLTLLYSNLVQRCIFNIFYPISHVS